MKTVADKLRDLADQIDSDTRLDEIKCGLKGVCVAIYGDQMAVTVVLSPACAETRSDKAVLCEQLSIFSQFTNYEQQRIAAMN